MGDSYAVSPETAIKGTLSNVQVTFAFFVEVLFTILFYDNSNYVEYILFFFQIY